MLRSFALYLGDLMRAADEILLFTQDMNREAYEKNVQTQRAVERCFEIIGEALRQMRQHYPAMMQNIDDSNQIIAFRNVIAHQYNSVDNDDVWSAVQSKLPAFREQVRSVAEKRRRESCRGSSHL